MRKKMLLTSLIFNVLLIVVGLIAVNKLGGWHFLFYKMKNRGLAGQYEHRKNLFEILPKDTAKIVFLGDSLTEQCEWSELFGNPNVINRGISGDHTIGILERLDVILENPPAKIYLMVGINDLFYHSPEATIENYSKLVQTILEKSPSTELVLQSLLPVNNLVKDITLSNETVKKVNTAIQKLAKQNQIKFINLYPHFIDADGDLKIEFTDDGIHLNGKGYLNWKKELMKYE